MGRRGDVDRSRRRYGKAQAIRSGKIGEVQDNFWDPKAPLPSSPSGTGPSPNNPPLTTEANIDHYSISLGPR